MGPITVPYVTPAEFQAAPTYLDTDDLRIGDSSGSDQTAELVNVLLRASGWAADYCGQSLHAHLVTEQRRLRCDRWGRIKFTPAEGPIRSAAAVTSVGYGYTSSAITTLASPQVWVDGNGTEPQNAVEVDISQTNAGPWVGQLQFGGPVPQGMVYATWTTTPGYPNTLITATANSGASALTVMDTTGIVPGDVLRIVDPGSEEAVTVLTAVGTTVTLTSPLLHTHTVDSTQNLPGIGLSMLPHPVKQAVINYAIASLLRPDQASQDPFPDTSVQPSSGDSLSREDGSGLLVEACRLLARYRRVT